jgi:hypothetical protein
MALLCGYIGVWGSSCVWPLYLSYAHQRRMAQRLNDVTSVAKISDLLSIPEGYEGWLPHSFATRRIVILFKSNNSVFSVCSTRI